MKLCFKVMKRNLADHRIEHIFYLASEQKTSGIRRCGITYKRLKRQHLSKDRGCLSKGQRRICHKIALFGRQHLMDTMSHFMRKRHDITCLAIKIHQDKGMGRRHCWMTESARCFTRTHACINPAFIKKPAGNGCHFWIKPSKRIQHNGVCIIPAIAPIIITRQRRVSIPPINGFSSHPARF